MTELRGLLTDNAREIKDGEGRRWMLRRAMRTSRSDIGQEIDPNMPIEEQLAWYGNDNVAVTWIATRERDPKNPNVVEEWLRAPGELRALQFDTAKAAEAAVHAVYG